MEGSPGMKRKRPVGSLPPSKPPAGPAPPRRPVCAPTAMSSHCIADHKENEMKRCVLAAGLALAALGLADPASAQQPVPFKGTLAGSFTASAEPPPATNRQLDAAGQATQLGTFTYDFPHSVDRSVVPSTGVGFATFTAANGDRVFAFVSGKATLV